MVKHNDWLEIDGHAWALDKIRSFHFGVGAEGQPNVVVCFVDGGHDELVLPEHVAAFRSWWEHTDVYKAMMQCGHDASAIVGSDEGTCYCSECEKEAENNGRVDL